MTTMQIDRAVVEQALEALEDVDGPITALLGGLLGSPDADAPGSKVRASITALRAALAQQAEPVLVQGELPPRYVARSPVQAESVQMHPSQFAELIKGKETMIGVPVYWSEWPSKEVP